MVQQEKTPTKEKIMRAAAKLFSEKGYDKVSTREITSTVGINPASLYYYFSSKDELLKSLYEIYREEMNKEMPDLDELLRLAETEPPHEVLMKSEFHFQDDVRGFFDQILITAARKIYTDSESEHFVRETIFEPVENILRPLLQRMMELGKIKPFDLDPFIRLLTYYCFSAATLNNSPLKQSVAEYQAGMALIFSVIAPTDA